MKINARRTEDGTFTLKFDQTEVVLSVADLKTLLLQVTRLLTPDAMKADASAQQEAGKLAETLKSATDIEVQAFIQAAGGEDILVLLKLGEEDQPLLDKLYGNMTDNMRTMFEEDLGFKYGDGVPDGPAKTAIREMNKTLTALAADGRFTLPVGN
jgi:hypothetical protein